MKNPLVFYDLLNYPTPKNKEYFFLFEKTDLNNHSNKEFTRNNKDLLLNTYINYINKFGFLFKSLPFVENIYLCNSITFNKLNENSDIDLFIVCKPQRLWLARFFSLCFFSLFGLRWFKKKKALKFDLGFFVTSDSLNFYSQTIKPYDIYFIYWIIHLVPLYSQNGNNIDRVFKHNKWIKEFTPNVDNSTSVNLGNKIYFGNTIIKKFFEIIFFGFIGNFCEKILKAMWLTIMVLRAKKIGNLDEILISDKILRFYGDNFRKEVNNKYANFKG